MSTIVFLCLLGKKWTGRRRTLAFLLLLLSFLTLFLPLSRSSKITQGPYNIISNWDYVGLIKSMHNAHGGNAVGGDPDSLFAVRCRTESEFDAALEEAKGREDALCFIEVVVDKDDCSKELLEWGSRVAAANGRAPNPQ